MRVYFLLEDSRSFFDTLPCWISLLKPTYRRVPEINRVYNGDCYVLKSGCGYPRILGVDAHSPSQNVLGATITDINRYQNIDRLIIVFDADDASIGKRYRTAIQAIKSYPGGLHCPFSIFIINHCFETWLLGNRNVYPKGKIPRDFQPFHNYYNVSQKDPEKMDGVREFMTTSIFHFEYLRQMLLTQRITYSKRNPGAICNKSYLEELRKRVYALRENKQPEGHLNSLKRFLDFLDSM